MNYKKQFEDWKNNIFFDEKTRAELANLTDEKEIEDRFYTSLEFGTAGLRGVMGAGTNRMNKYTVGKATLGFARYLIDTFGSNDCLKRGVVICYDTRNNSYDFSKIAAAIFSSMNIKVYLYKSPRPIPVLSYTIRKFGAVGGVMVTASHNPKEYNGYKTYDEYGCQLVPELAEKVINYVNNVKTFEEINFTENKKLVKNIDETNSFVKTILKQSKVSDKQAKLDLKVVYTPLHGTGYIPVLKTLHADGFKNVFEVKQQIIPDGNFPTVVSPNPEDRRALELGINLAEKLDADIVLGTDPDCDRVGVAVKTNDGYKLLTGNHTGILLVDFILSQTDLTKVNNPAVIKTIVTSELGAEIAKNKGAVMFSTLTGFKYIGEKIMQFEQAKKAGDSDKNYSFLFGYEESYGCLAGTHARDKDAVVACMLIAEMAAFYKKKGKNLNDRLNEIYAEYGYYLDTQDSFTLKGKEGLEKIQNMMKNARQNPPKFDEKAKMIDYKKGVDAEHNFGKYPKENVVKFVFIDGSWMVIRPSGTEPKIKIYYSIKGKDEKAAEKRFNGLRKTILKFLGLNK